MIGYASNTKGLFKLEDYFVDGKIIKTDDMSTFKEKNTTQEYYTRCIYAMLNFGQ